MRKIVFEAILERLKFSQIKNVLKVFYWLKYFKNDLCNFDTLDVCNDMNAMGMSNNQLRHNDAF